MTAEEREAILDSTIRAWAPDGWRVETRSQFQATMISGRPPGARMLRGGLLGVAAGRKERRVVISVTESGQLDQAPVAS